MKASFNHWCRRQQARSDLCRSPSAYSGGGATCYGNRVRIRFGFQTVPTRILFPQLDGGRLDEPCWLICVALKVTLGCFSFSVFLLMMFYVLNCNISKSTKVRSGTNLTASAWTKKKTACRTCSIVVCAPSCYLSTHRNHLKITPVDPPASAIKPSCRVCDLCRTREAQWTESRTCVSECIGWAVLTVVRTD